MMMVVGDMGLQSAEVIARQEEADFADRQELQRVIYPRAIGRRVRKGGNDAWLSCALYCYCTIKGRCRRGKTRKKRGAGEKRSGYGGLGGA